MAIVFPGQGSQRPGMGRDVFERFPAAREVFGRSSEALGLDVAALCFDDDPRLDQTEFTQPAILTTEIAMLRAFEGETGLRPSCFGGHSLGEYTALCAAGTMPLEDAVRVVRKRGALMQAAVPAGAGAMIAICSPGVASRDLDRDLADLEVDVANRNSPDQIVLSGGAPAIDRAAGRIAELLGDVEHDIVRLNVSAPFHSRAMRVIEDDLRATLEAVSPRLVAARAAMVTSNFTGRFHRPVLSHVIDALVLQVSGTVEWVADMRALAAVAATIYELGPSRPLKRFFGAMGCDVVSITSAKGMAQERCA